MCNWLVGPVRGAVKEHKSRLADSAGANMTQFEWRIIARTALFREAKRDHSSIHDTERRGTGLIDVEQLC
jgi:hypothetical protein